MTRKQKIITLTAVAAFSLTGITVAHDYAVSQAKAARAANPQATPLACPLGFDKPGLVTPVKQPADKPPAPIVLYAHDIQKLHQIACDAAREGDLKTLTAYFESGFDVNQKNPRADTLLILAAYHGQDKAVALILTQKNVDLDYKNNMGFTALTGAVYKGHNTIVKQLIDAGASVNTANGSGQTPLMFASLFGREDAARLLIASGAAINATDANGNSAATLARVQGNQKMLDILQKPSVPAGTL